MTSESSYRQGTRAAIGSFLPGLRAPDLRTRDEALLALDLPPDVQIPRPPGAITRPATPMVAVFEIDESITIGRRR
ncbi:MAG: hypothetical protein V3T25_08915 [Gemmatimonadota bacterium]